MIHQTREVQVVDFFSGCGGTSYGFARANTSGVTFRVVGALDIDPHANATYERMLGIAPLDNDIREFQDEDTLARAARKWAIEKTKPLLLIGCAPCQGFSSHRKKDPRNDVRNGLLQVFADIVISLKPDWVVMENVPEMFDKKHWEHYDSWRETLTSAGYRVRAQIHNLAEFGVPQERFRALVLAARDGSNFRMPKPKYRPSEFRTVREAIGSLPPLESGGQDPLDSMHIASRHRPATLQLIRQIPIDGGSRRSLPSGVGPNCWEAVDGFRDVYGRLSWDKPAVAITARCRTPSCGRFVHPAQHRGLSVREAALLQGFPLDYHFEGPFDDKFKQIGNAVSPVFAEAIASHIAKEISEPTRADDQTDEEFDITTPLQKSFSSSIAALKRRLRETDQPTATLV